jgi:sodium pump decarboxylase gamma subunit
MLIFGLKVSLIGMGIVFFALVLLVFIIRGISMAAGLLDRRTSAVQEAPAGVSAASVVLIRETNRGEEEEIAAVISAAVAAYRGDRG